MAKTTLTPKEAPLREIETGVRYPNGKVFWYHDRFNREVERAKFQEEFNAECARICVEPAQLIFVRRTRTTTFTDPEEIV